MINVHRSGPAPKLFQEIGMDTGAPARARGENAQMVVSVRLFRFS